MTVSFALLVRAAIGLAFFVWLGVGVLGVGVLGVGVLGVSIFVCVR
jgi:hypothetical protein